MGPSLILINFSTKYRCLAARTLDIFPMTIARGRWEFESVYQPQV